MLAIDIIIYFLWGKKIIFMQCKMSENYQMILYVNVLATHFLVNM